MSKKITPEELRAQAQVLEFGCPFRPLIVGEPDSIGGYDVTAFEQRALKAAKALRRAADRIEELEDDEH